MIKVLFVGIGGFIGAIFRYLIGLIPLKTETLFPIKTFLINIIGSFLIGIITALVLKNALQNENLQLFLKVGICGGFTTFSTYSLETFDLFKNGNVFLGISYVLLSVIIGILAILFAFYIVKQ